MDIKSPQLKTKFERLKTERGYESNDHFLDMLLIMYQKEMKLEE